MRTTRRWPRRCPGYRPPLLVPGGFGVRGVEGKIKAIRYAREHQIPYLGICLGMQLAGDRYTPATWQDCGRQQQPSSIPTARHPVVALITRMAGPRRKVERRSANSDMGGTMRLGAAAGRGVPGIQVEKIYGGTTVNERHRHRYEVNTIISASWKKPAWWCRARQGGEAPAMPCAR